MRADEGLLMDNFSVANVIGSSITCAAISCAFFRNVVVSGFMAVSDCSKVT